MEKLGFSEDTLPILWVALITWGGVLLYLVRLDMLSRQVADEVRAHDEIHTDENNAPIRDSSLDT